MMNKEQYTYIIRYGVAAIAVAALCAPVVWRTEAMLSVSDVWGYRAVAALAVLALTTVCLGRRSPRLHWADGVALFWWVCVSLNYVFVSSCPAAEVYGKAMALGVAYVALRLVIPYCGRAFTRLWWVGLCAAGGYELWTGFMQLMGREASRHHLFDVTGTFFNPGPYAIFVAVVWAVSVAWWYRHGEAFAGRGRWSRVGAWSVAAVAVFCFPVLVATWSRAAWVAVAVAAACLLWKKHRRWVLGGMGVAACAGVAAYFLKQGSADGRLLMTMVAGQAWAGEWLCGHGLGGYAQAYGAVQEAFFAAHPGSPLSVVAGSPEYAFNGVLGVGVEQGVLGGVPALVLGLWSLAVLVGLVGRFPVFLSFRLVAVPVVGCGVGLLGGVARSRNGGSAVVEEDGRMACGGRGRLVRVEPVVRYGPARGGLRGVPPRAWHPGCGIFGRLP